MESVAEHSILDCSADECPVCLAFLSDMNVNIDIRLEKGVSEISAPDASIFNMVHVPATQINGCSYLLHYIAKWIRKSIHNIRMRVSPKYRQAYEWRCRFHADIDKIIDKHWLSALKLPGSIYEWYFLGMKGDLWFINVENTAKPAVMTRIPRAIEKYRIIMEYNIFEMSLDNKGEAEAPPEDLTQMELRWVEPKQTESAAHAPDHELK